MSGVLPYLLIWLQEYGYPILWLVVFISAAGIPLPTSLVLLAAGAFAGSGDFSLPILIGVAITAFIAGDSLGYLLGRLWGSKLLDWLETSGKIPFIKPRTVIRSRDYFNRLGGWAIFGSRFLVSALGGTINILAGAERYPYWRFIFYDVGGETLGAALPVVLGYIFGASWASVGDILSSFSLLLLALLALFWLVYQAWRIIKPIFEQRAAAMSGKEAGKTLGSFVLLLLAALASFWLAFLTLRIVQFLRKKPATEPEPSAESTAELTMVATPLPNSDAAGPSSSHLPL